jgi:hypothetical protein
MMVAELRAIWIGVITDTLTDEVLRMTEKYFGKRAD